MLEKSAKDHLELRNIAILLETMSSTHAQRNGIAASAIHFRGEFFISLNYLKAFFLLTGVKLTMLFIPAGTFL